MTPEQLANQAALKVKPLAQTFAPEILRQMALGHIAQWIYMQDEETSDKKIRQTAARAIALVNDSFQR